MNPLNDVSSFVLLRNLYYRGPLKKLNLSFCRIGRTSAPMVASILSRASCTLTDVNLAGSSFDAEACAVIARSCSDNQSLRALDLSFNSIGQEAAPAFASMLQQNSSLEELRLRSCGLGQAGGCILSEGLKNNFTLKMLDVRDNFVGEKGTTAITARSHISVLKLLL